MFLHFRRRPLYIYFISEDEMFQGKMIISLLLGYGEYLVLLIEMIFSICSSTCFVFYIENLLNSSKSTNETITRPSVQLEEEEDERHERTGSVKFADQADENKEVNFSFLVSGNRMISFL